MGKQAHQNYIIWSMIGALAFAGLILTGCTSHSFTSTAPEHQPVRVEIHDSRGLLQGHPIAGEPLTAVPVCPSGTCTTALAYQWVTYSEDGQAKVIPGATTKTYIPTTEDMKHKLSVRVSSK